MIRVISSHRLEQFREKAKRSLLGLEVPTKRMEDWRYSDIGLLKMHEGEAIARRVEATAFDKDSYYVVMVNGRLDKGNSRLPDEGVTAYGCEEEEFLMEIEGMDLRNGFDGKYQVLQAYSRASGVLIEVVEALDKPLKIYYLNEVETCQIVFMKIHKGASLALHEEFIEGVFINHVTKIDLAEDASVKHFKKNFFHESSLRGAERRGNPFFSTKTEDGLPRCARNDGPKARHCEEQRSAAIHLVGTIKEDELPHCARNDVSSVAKLLYSGNVTCKKSSQYNSYVLNFGCASYRQEIECELLGEYSSCGFHGVNLGIGQEKYDVVLKVKHKASNTSSMQHYNQVLADSSKGSFYSKIEILPDLHKIEAHQLNKNLLLNKNAQSFSRPELDIHSDDVICSHGATVGNIDADVMQYLRSRGIEEKEAERLVLEAFVKSVFEDKGLDAVDSEDLIFQVIRRLK
jgi:Fe-S cluster assembly scaffold protein SufB